MDEIRHTRRRVESPSPPPNRARYSSLFLLRKSSNRIFAVCDRQSYMLKRATGPALCQKTMNRGILSR